MIVKADDVRRSPSGDRWRVLFIETRQHARRPHPSVRVVALEKLTGRIRGYGWYRELCEVEGWPLVAAGEVA